MAPPRSSARWSTVGALGGAAIAGAACAIQLAAEGTRLGGQRGRAEHAVGVVAVGLALLCASSAARWALLRRPVLLPQRLGSGAYLALLGLSFALALTGGHLWSAQGRPALAGFAGLLSALTLVVGLGLVPTWALDERGILDVLGRRMGLPAFRAFSLQCTQPAPPRFLLRLVAREAGEPFELRLADVDTTAVSATLEAAALERRSG
jgi:hypothetical protein